MLDRPPADAARRLAVHLDPEHAGVFALPDAQVPLVPREQLFFRDHGHKLRHVGLIKTSGGLFDHMAGKVRRAPLAWQRLGFEWLWRLLMEPRRLFVRYLTTNPKALFAILRNSR